MNSARVPNGNLVWGKAKGKYLIARARLIRTHVIVNHVIRVIVHFDCVQRLTHISAMGSTAIEFHMGIHGDRNVFVFRVLGCEVRRPSKPLHK